MGNKNNLINISKNGLDVVATKDQSSNALHKLTQLAEQALRTQQNNQSKEAKPKETKK